MFQTGGTAAKSTRKVCCIFSGHLSYPHFLFLRFAEEMKGSLGGSSSQTTTALSIVERDRELAAMVQQVILTELLFFIGVMEGL